MEAKRAMVRVRFITTAGAVVEAEGAVGENLLTLAHASSMPLEGTCEGQMACSTCHVIVAPEWFPRLSVATDEEEDMLDLATGVRPTSRLACQIVLTPLLDGLTVQIPGESRDMRRR